MRRAFAIAIGVILCAAIAVAVFRLDRSTGESGLKSKLGLATETGTSGPRSVQPAADLATPYIDKRSLEDAGVAFAHEVTGAIRDPNSLAEIREAVGSRGRIGISVLSAALEQMHLGPNTPPDKLENGIQLRKKLGMLFMYEGKFADAAKMFEQGQKESRTAGISADLRAEMTALRGIAAMRRGETENCIECIGPQAAFFPSLAKPLIKKRPDLARRSSTSQRISRNGLATSACDGS